MKKHEDKRIHRIQKRRNLAALHTGGLDRIHGKYDGAGAGLQNSLLVLAAYENEELLGIVRVVGDGATIILVQDILVYPQKQRQGIGTSLLKAVLERYADVRQIQLVTDNTPKTVAFYQSLGFVELEKLGCCGFMRAR